MNSAVVAATKGLWVSWQEGTYDNACEELIAEGRTVPGPTQVPDLSQAYRRGN